MVKKSGLWLGAIALFVCLAFSAQTVPAADFYFGNFEEDVQFGGQYILDRTAAGYAGWFDWDYAPTGETRPPQNMSPSTDYGVTTGTYSMALQPYGGYDQNLTVHLQDLPAATRDVAFPALLSHTQLAMNVTWNNDDFADDNLTWYEQYLGDGWNGANVQMVINFGPDGGYHELGAPTIDTGNMDYPGGWDLSNYSGVHNRVVTWDYSEYLPAIQALADAGTLSATDGWMEFMLITTTGNFDTPVTYYIDSWRFTGELPGLDGDYNDDGTIDAADYTTWRDVMTAGGTELANDPTPGTVDETDYDYWKAHYGETAGAGAALSLAAVPEPASAVLAIVALGLVGLLRRRSR